MEYFCTTEQRIGLSPLAPQVNLLLTIISGTAYFVYVGYTAVAITPQFVEFENTTGGTGAQTAECGLFSTPNPPNKSASQSLTKLVATGTLTALTGTGMMRNNAAFATQVAAGTHLWAGVRIAMATTQPVTLSLGGDMSEGFVLSLVGSGALTGAGPFTGSLITLSGTVGVCPDVRVTLD